MSQEIRAMTEPGETAFVKHQCHVNPRPLCVCVYLYLSIYLFIYLSESEERTKDIVTPVSEKEDRIMATGQRTLCKVYVV